MEQLTLLLAPVIYILFGGSGDLATRFLFPSLYTLWKNGKLPTDFLILGVSCDCFSDGDYREYVSSQMIKHGLKQPADWDTFSGHLKFHHINLNIDKNDLTGFLDLKQLLMEFESIHGQSKQIFFGALPPAYFGKTIDLLLKANVLNQPERQVLLIEKPIATEMKEGSDLLQIIGRVKIPVLLNEHFASKVMAKAMPLFVHEAPAEIMDMFQPKNIQVCRAIANETIGVPNNRVNFYNHCPGIVDMHSHLILPMLSQFIVSLNNRYSD